MYFLSFEHIFFLEYIPNCKPKLPHQQGSDLRRIFHFIVNLLGEVVKVEGKMSGELSSLLLKLLVIAETTLTWSFISLHHILLLLVQSV